MVNDFNSSIRFDQRHVPSRTSPAPSPTPPCWASMGIISQKRMPTAIIDGLKGILADIEAGKVEFSARQRGHPHERGDHPDRSASATAGKRLHTARSRNDQVAVDFRLYLAAGDRRRSSACCWICEEVLLQTRPSENQDAVMPGYTHLQRAQPITFAHHLMAYANMLCRDVTRLEDCLAAHGRVPPGRRRPGRHHLPHRPACRRPRLWASTAHATTAWTACPTGTTAIELLSGLFHPA